MIASQTFTHAGSLFVRTRHGDAKRWLDCRAKRM